MKRYGERTDEPPKVGSVCAGGALSALSERVRTVSESGKSEEETLRRGEASSALRARVSG